MKPNSKPKDHGAGHEFPGGGFLELSSRIAKLSVKLEEAEKEKSLKIYWAIATLAISGIASVVGFSAGLDFAPDSQTLCEQFIESGHANISVDRNPVLGRAGLDRDGDGVACEV